LDELLDAGKQLREVEKLVDDMRLDEMLQLGHSTRIKFIEQIRQSGVSCKTVK